MSYSIYLLEEASPGGGTHWLALHPDLVGCHAIGHTEEEALAELGEARDTWLRVTAAQGGTIPPEQSDPAITIQYLYQPGRAQGVASKEPVTTVRLGQLA